MPLNTGSFTEFAILNGGRGGYGVGKGICRGGEDGGGVGGWVFVGTLALLTRQHSVENPVLLLHRHSEEAQSTGYIQVLFHFYP